jgi:hypothetical protein
MKNLVMNINSIEADFEVLGEANEFENPIDRFALYATVDFEIGDESFSESVQFSSAYSEDVAEFVNFGVESYEVVQGTASVEAATMDNIDDIQAFLNSILQKVGSEMKALKATLS